jgi:NAD-dependent dihydropyrimidine dehydrogenase PreA subunit
MNRVSNRALANFIVDAAIAAAFVVSAVSGLVFLVPAGWLSVPGTAAGSALGVEYATWRTLHDWTALIMIAGVVLHTALHWRWVTTMVRRLAGAQAQTRPAAIVGRRLPAAVGPSAATLSTAAASEPTDVTPSLGDGEPVRTDDRSREGFKRSSLDDVKARESVARESFTRHAFLKGAGAVGAAALVGGFVGRAVAGTAASWLDEGSSTGGASTTASVAQDSTGGWGSGADDGQSSSSSSGDGGSAQATTPTARVAIDGGRCTGCGACAQVCPFGVFSAQDGRAVVADESACRLCGHCVQVCRPGAITLNG